MQSIPTQRLPWMISSSGMTVSSARMGPMRGLTLDALADGADAAATTRTGVAADSC